MNFSSTCTTSITTITPTTSTTTTTSSPYIQDQNEVIAAFKVDSHGFFETEIGLNLKQAKAVLDALEQNNIELLPRGLSNLHFVFESPQLRDTALVAVRCLIVNIDPYAFFESELDNYEQAESVRWALYKLNWASTISAVESLPEDKKNLAFIFASEKTRNAASRAINHLLGKRGLYDGEHWRNGKQHLKVALERGCIRTVHTLNDYYINPYTKPGASPTIIHPDEFLDICEQLEKKAHEGDAVAAYQLGLLIHYNVCPNSPSLDFFKEQNQKAHPRFSSAFDFFMLAADLGQPDALCELGKIYRSGGESSGKKIKADISTAEIYLNQAAQLGSDEAKAILRQMYLNGEGSPAFTLAYFENGDINDDTEAAYQLGRLYEQGRIVDKNAEKASALIKKAADSDNPDALYHYGISLLTNNPKEGLTYLNKAHEKGHTRATCELGIIYDEGKIVTQDCDHALQLLNQASESDLHYVNYRKGVSCLERGDNTGAKQFFLKVDLTNYEPKYAFWMAKVITDNHSLFHRYLKCAAEAGIEGAWYALGKFYSEIDQNEAYPDEPKVTGYKRDVLIDECFKKEIKKGCNDDMRREALVALALVRRFRICSYEKAFPLSSPSEEAHRYLMLANQSMMQLDFHPASQTDRYTGYGKQDIEKLKQAAQAGYPDAMFRMGYFLITCHGDCPTCETDGMNYLVQATQHGDQPARYQIFTRAQHYEKRSTKGDKEKAIRYYQMAADLTYSGPAYFTARLFEPRDREIEYYDPDRYVAKEIVQSAKEALKRLGVEEFV